jgi:hypothetical protein
MRSVLPRERTTICVRRSGGEHAVGYDVGDKLRRYIDPSVLCALGVRRAVHHAKRAKIAKR